MIIARREYLVLEWNYEEKSGCLKLSIQRQDLIPNSILLVLHSRASILRNNGCITLNVIEGNERRKINNFLANNLLYLLEELASNLENSGLSVKLLDDLVLKKKELLVTSKYPSSIAVEPCIGERDSRCSISS